jgi:hypothetical protein
MLVINKTDLAEAVGASLEVMDRDAKLMRGTGPTVFAQVKHGVGLPEIIANIVGAFDKSHGLSDHIHCHKHHTHEDKDKREHEHEHKHEHDHKHEHEHEHKHEHEHNHEH